MMMMMYICMYVCVYIYVCVCVCIYIYTHTHTHTHIYVCVRVCVCIWTYIWMHIHIQWSWIYFQQLTAWLTFMASSYVRVNETANGNMFPYIFQKSSITKATQNTAFLSDINYEFCSSYGFAIGKQCCTPLMQPACYLLPSLVSKP